MDRRAFMESILAGCVALRIPPPEMPIGLLLGEDVPRELIRDFDRTAEYGNVIGFCTGHGKYISPETWRMLQETLIADAKRRLHKRVRFELRLKVATDFGRHHGMAWYSQPERMSFKMEWPDMLLGVDDRYSDSDVANTGYYWVGRGTA